MKKILVACLFGLLALASAVPAQKTDTVPPGFDSKVTSDLLDFTMWFGAFPNARYQLAVGSPKQTAKTISQIEFRQEDRLFSPNAKARTWTNVTLAMAETNASKMSATWSTNVLTTPTTVFSGQIHFPNLNRPPSRRPAAWGMGGKRFPFSKPFVYTAKQDLLSDFTFRGGRLSNQATWNTTMGLTYVLDGVSSRSFSGGTATIYGNLFTCKDSAQVLAGYSNVFVLSYAKTTGDAKRDDKFEFCFNHERLAPNANVIDGLGLQGVALEAQGLNVGACRPLMMAPLVLLGFRTNAQGGGNTKGKLLPYNAKLVGTKLWTQTAYADSKTGAFSLSMVSLTQVQVQPPVRPWTAQWVYLPDTKPASGRLRMLHAPLQRITFK